MYKKYEELRNKRGVTDYRVAEETQITKSTFSEWKAGRYTPKVDKIQRIAKFFDVPIEYFLEGDD